MLFNISKQTHYKESWSKIRDGGYKLKLDAIPFQAAKTSSEIISDVSEITANFVQYKIPATPDCFCSGVSVFMETVFPSYMLRGICPMLHSTLGLPSETKTQ